MANTDIVRAFFDLIEMGDTESLDDLLAEDATFNVGGLPAPLDKRQATALFTALVRALPDLDFNARIDGVADPVEVLTTLTGTHTRALDLSDLQLPTVDATGRRVALPMETSRFEVFDNHIRSVIVDPVEGGGVLGLMAQLDAPLTQTII